MALIDVLNLINTEGSAMYQARVPLATRTNLGLIGSAITEYQATENEFLSALVNRIGLTMVRNKVYSNPLQLLKSGGVPLGSDVQEIFTNPAEAEIYDGNGSTLLTRKAPDTKAIYHRMDRQAVYTATITRAQLKLAFTSFDKLEELLNSIVNSLYSGNQIDEFILMKNVFASAITAVVPKIVLAGVTPVTDQTTAQALVEGIKEVSMAMTFPSTALNSYLPNAKVGDTKGVNTWTPVEDQILILNSHIATKVDVEVLAQAFNIGKVEFMARTLKVDNFGSATKCLAILADKTFPQVYDNLFEVSEFYNPKGMYYNYFLNVWQTYSMSLFANAVAFMTP